MDNKRIKINLILCSMMHGLNHYIVIFFKPMYPMMADYFGLENEPNKWPRHYHAKLIQTLKEQGAKAIVFDVFFKEPRDSLEDKNLASVIKDAGNVILFSQLKRQILPEES